MTTMSDEQVTQESNQAIDPIVARIMRDNEVLGNWVFGLLEGCEGCTEEAIKWVEGQRAMGLAAASHGEEE